jgi:hypothetical protein
VIRDADWAEPLLPWLRDAAQQAASGGAS